MTRSAPVWLCRATVLAAHQQILAVHGGADGLRDPELLDSALARARHRHHYEKCDLCDLAAAYAFGIVRNHPFLDGNKRAGFLAASIFLERNGRPLIADAAHAAVAVLDLAAGRMDEAGFAEWLRDDTRPSRRRTRRPRTSRG